ncbi:hypothetical protein L1987_85048 [Smallanthus sonchifolius]|uniref:Uncharacterized protein n=1 Tax=Smallanthus sonchifolius TaxID=185202 RepID=A0ACB8XVG0_9ASTR|nr:hypothetical protein L1987_85048 [Smallanthus sonchifolius]
MSLSTSNCERAALIPYNYLCIYWAFRRGVVSIDINQLNKVFNLSQNHNRGTWCWPEVIYITRYNRKQQKLKCMEKITSYCQGRHGNKFGHHPENISGGDEDLELPLFGLSTILKATNNFSNINKLGEDGFGPVYKGVLEDGKEIAIEAKTNRLVGIYGYMAPKYAGGGIFFIKSDVYNFDVLLLEIVCGEKNRGFVHKEHYNNLMGHAWGLYNEGRSLELVASRAWKAVE